MAISISTALRNHLLSTGSLSAALGGGLMKVYSGTPPAADDAPTGTLLCTISDNSTGAGLSFDAASAGTLPKASAQTWSGNNAATGTAGYFRISESGDDDSAGGTKKRLQGTCGTAAADYIMTSTALASGAPLIVDAANFAMPGA